METATATVEGELGWGTDFKQRFKMGKIIGIGFFGRVYIGSEIATGREVAIKVMPKQRGKLTRERTLEKLLLEVESLRTLQSTPNAVRLLGVFEDEEEVQMVTELCAGGDLEQLSEQVGNLPERAVALIAYEVLKIVDACHEAHILHGDIKPANFMLRTRKENPLASPDPRMTSLSWLAGIDFGCAQPVGDERLHLRAGTPTYMAPECLGRDYHIEADLWSVGTTLYQLYARRTDEWRAYEECRRHILENPEADSPLPLTGGPWASMSPEGRELIGAMLARDYPSRITAKQALQHPWFAKWVPNFKAATPTPVRAPAASSSSSNNNTTTTTTTFTPSSSSTTSASSSTTSSSASSSSGTWPRRAAGMPASQTQSPLRPNPAAPQPQPQPQPQQAAKTPTPPPPPRPVTTPARVPAPKPAPAAAPASAKPSLPTHLGGGVGPSIPYTHKELPPHMREIDERAPVFKPDPAPKDGARSRWTVSRPSWWRWGSSASDDDKPKVSGTSFEKKK